MSEELFPVESVTMESPKLKWTKLHGVKTFYSPLFEIDGDEEPWIAWFPDNDNGKGIPKDLDSCGTGHTEEEAIRDLACIYDEPLWNEL